MLEKLPQTDSDQQQLISGSELLPPAAAYLLNRKLSVPNSNEEIEGGWDLLALTSGDDGVYAVLYKPIEDSDKVRRKRVRIDEVLKYNQLEAYRETDGGIEVDEDDTVPRAETSPVLAQAADVGQAAVKETTDVEVVAAGPEASRDESSIGNTTDKIEQPNTASDAVHEQAAETVDFATEPEPALDADIVEVAPASEAEVIEPQNKNLLSSAEQEVKLKELFGPDFDLEGIELTDDGHVIPSMDRLFRSAEDFNRWIHTDRVPVIIKQQIVELSTVWTDLQNELARKQFIDETYAPTFAEIVESTRRGGYTVKGIGDGVSEIAQALRNMQRAAEARDMVGIKQAAKRANIDYPVVEFLSKAKTRLDELADDGGDRRKVLELEDGVMNGARRANQYLRSDNYPFDSVYEQFDALKDRIRDAVSLETATTMLAANQPVDVRTWNDLEEEVTSLNMHNNRARRAVGDRKFSDGLLGAKQDVEMLVDMLRRNRIETELIGRALQRLDRQVLPALHESQQARAMITSKNH